MKKILTIVFALAMASANIFAQAPTDKSVPKKSPEERAENMTKRVTKELSLKPEQVEKVKAIILKREKERDALMDARKEEMDKINAEFKNILTAEQFQIFEKKRDEMIQKRKERRMPPEGKDDGLPPPPEGPKGK